MLLTLIYVRRQLVFVSCMLKRSLERDTSGCVDMVGNCFKFLHHCFRKTAINAKLHIVGIYSAYLSFFSNINKVNFSLTVNTLKLSQPIFSIGLPRSQSHICILAYRCNPSSGSPRVEMPLVFWPC